MLKKRTVDNLSVSCDAVRFLYRRKKNERERGMNKQIKKKISQLLLVGLFFHSAYWIS